MRIGKRISHWMVPVALLATAACGGETENTADDTAAAPAADAGATAPAQAPAATPGADAAAPGSAAPAAGTAGAAPAGNAPAGMNAAAVQQGQQIFNGPGNCFTCHGQNGQGGPLAPSLTDSEWIWVQPGPAMHTQLVTLIKTGVSTPKKYPAPMPAMGGAQLSDEQLQAVAAYVHSISPQG